MTPKPGDIVEHQWRMMDRQIVREFEGKLGFIGNVVLEGEVIQANVFQPISNWDEWDVCGSGTGDNK